MDLSIRGSNLESLYLYLRCWARSHDHNRAASSVNPSFTDLHSSSARSLRDRSDEIAEAGLGLLGYDSRENGLRLLDEVAIGEEAPVEIGEFEGGE